MAKKKAYPLLINEDIPKAMKLGQMMSYDPSMPKLSIYCEMH